MMDHIWLFTQFKKGKSSALDDPAVNQLLSLYFPNSDGFIRTEEGRPVIKSIDREWVDFNISHTKDLLLLGISSNGRIGVDVERKTHRKPWAAIAQDLFSSCEQDEDKFYRAWTAREAFAKALGVSIFKILKRITISYCSDGAFIGLDGEFTHRIEFFELEPHYIGAICKEKKSIIRFQFFIARSRKQAS